MSPEDVALCQKAIELANSGQKQAAYEQFSAIHNHGNPEDVTLLYWIAVTTPSLEEAQRAMDTIARIEPDHPKLKALRSYIDRTLPEVIDSKPQDTPMDKHSVSPVPVSTNSFGRGCAALTIAPLLAFLAVGIMLAIGLEPYSYITIGATTMYYILLTASLVVFGIPVWCIVFGPVAAAILRLGDRDDRTR